jgi:hypothetical protein
MGEPKQYSCCATLQRHAATAVEYPPFSRRPWYELGRLSGNFYAPRPIVEGEVTHPEHPIFYGYAKTALPLKFTNGPLLQVPGRTGTSRCS